MPEVFLPRDWPEDATPDVPGASVTRAPGPVDALPAPAVATSPASLPPIADAGTEPVSLPQRREEPAVAPAAFWTDAERAERRGRRRRRSLAVLAAFAFMLAGLHLGGVVVWEAVERGPRWTLGESRGSAVVLHPDPRPIVGDAAILRTEDGDDVLGVVEVIEGDDLRFRSGEDGWDASVDDARRVVLVMPWLGFVPILLGPVFA